MFGELYKLGNQVECNTNAKGLYTIAAKDNEKHGIIVCNTTESTRKINVDLEKGYKVYIVDKNNFIKETQYDPTCFTLKKYQIAYIKNF